MAPPCFSNVIFDAWAVAPVLEAEAGGNAAGLCDRDHGPARGVIDEVLATGGITTAIIIKLPAAGELPAWLAG